MGFNGALGASAGVAARPAAASADAHLSRKLDGVKESRREKRTSGSGDGPTAEGVKRMGDGVGAVLHSLWGCVFFSKSAVWCSAASPLFGWDEAMCGAGGETVRDRPSVTSLSLWGFLPRPERQHQKETRSPLTGKTHRGMNNEGATQCDTRKCHLGN